ncbi:MAG: hypothetical protein LC745_10325, partial [Planctomycetia bacterium]|nr:hypothetical protein [Planctomycetia bacterium]
TGTHAYATSRASAVTAGPFTVTGVTPPTLIEGGAFSGTVALLDSGNPLAVPKDYIATIDFGDNTAPVQGTLVNQGNGVFTVSSAGGHVYAEEGVYTVTVSVVTIATGDFNQSSSTLTVTDAPLTPAQTPQLFGFAGTAVSGAVASFTEYANAPLSDFTASIDWGDNQTTQGTVTLGPQGTFLVTGDHLYTVVGNYPINVTVHDVGGSTGVVTGAAAIGDPQISSTSNPITAVERRPFSGVLATFTEPNTFATAGEFAATIDWGDNTPKTAGVVTGSNGSFTVSGTHTFNTASLSTPVTVTVVHTLGGSTTSSTGLAHVLALLDRPGRPLRGGHGQHGQLRVRRDQQERHPHGSDADPPDGRQPRRRPAGDQHRLPGRQGVGQWRVRRHPPHRRTD